MLEKQFIAESEALDAVRRAINKVLGKRWMIAIWNVEEAAKEGEPNILKLKSKVTWRFPTGDYAESLRLLEKVIKEEVEETISAPPKPLEMADFLMDEEKEEVEVNNPPVDEPSMTDMMERSGFVEKSLPEEGGEE